MTCSFAAARGQTTAHDAEERKDSGRCRWRSKLTAKISEIDEGGGGRLR